MLKNWLKKKKKMSRSLKTPTKMDNNFSPSGHDSVVSSYLSQANYRNPERCKSDILGTLHHYPALKPKLDRFIFNDGQDGELLCLEGTIPVPYR